jgi:two-component system response regulator PilR (NtrC family)/two-component system response regulator AtoC
LVEQGLFRSDLYYRLAGVEIIVPPLRARVEDIAELAHYFLERYRYTRSLALSPGAQEALRVYQWPGNVRELQRVLERAVALTETDRIELDDLPPQIRGEFAEILWPSLERGDSLRTWGSRYARLVFERCGRNKRTACRVLDISYHTLRGYLRPAASRRTTTQDSSYDTAPGLTWVQSASDPAGRARRADEEA